MIPLKSLAPRYTFPFVTLILIAINAVVWFYQVSLSPSAQEQLIHTYGLVPHTLELGLTGHVPLIAAIIPLFTCMFFHAGWLHIIGNMWFLWIFGADVEDRFGHISYLGFYLLCGVGSAITQACFTLGSRLPEVGASGAIAESSVPLCSSSPPPASSRSFRSSSFGSPRAFLPSSLWAFGSRFSF